MRRMGFVLAFCLGAFGLNGHPATYMTKPQLLLSAESAKPGDTVMAAMHFTMAPEWHIYWRNPGDSGIATSIQWKLPKGITAGPIKWPTPKVLAGDGLTTYIYEQEVLLVVPLKIADAVAAGPLTLKATASWLE